MVLNRVERGWCELRVIKYDSKITIYFIEHSLQERYHDASNSPHHVLAVVAVLAHAGHELWSIVI